MKYSGRELRRQHAGDAGYDLSAAHMVEIPPMSSALVRTGTSVEIPAGHVGLVRGRSGLALSSVLAFEGTIDSGYRGEIKVLMLNMGHLPAIIHTGYRIAQLVVVPRICARWRLILATMSNMKVKRMAADETHTRRLATQERTPASKKEEVAHESH